MDTIRLHDKGQVKMIAHRGLSGIERENTYPAFVAAGNRSYFGIETDVHKSADGRFVILHDETTFRVSLGESCVAVEQSPFSAVENLLLPDLDDRVARRDIRIPLLADYVAICKKYEKVGVLELKNHFAAADIARILDEIRAADYLSQMIFISFDLENCLAVRRLLPDAAVQWLTDRPLGDDMLPVLRDNRLDLDIRYDLLTRETVETMHGMGRLVNCWTCNRAEDAAALAAMGVDFITTNILE